MCLLFVRQNWEIFSKFFLGQACITLANEFELLCLKKYILGNVLISLHTSRGDSLDKKTNETFFSKCVGATKYGCPKKQMSLNIWKTSWNVP